jgi:hypothetical protein
MVNLKQSPKSEQQPKTRLVDYPSYVAALNKVNELKDEGAELLSAIIQLESGTGNIDDVGLAAAELVGGGVAVAFKPAAKLKETRERHEVVKAAIIMAEKLLGNARTQASAELLEAKVPAYRLLVQEFADNLMALAETRIKLQRFQDDLRRAGVEPQPPIGKIRWPFPGHVATCLNEAFTRIERVFGITPKSKG